MKKIDSILPLLAALLVLLSNIWKAETTLVVSVALLILLSIYTFVTRKEDPIIKKDEIEK